MAVATDQRISSIIDVQNRLNASHLVTSDEQAAKLFRPPEFVPPYPVILNPHFSADEEHEWTRVWLLGQKINKIVDDKTMKTLLNMENSRLSAVFQPRAGEWGFRWNCKYINFLFLVDDLIDATLIGKEAGVTLSLLLDIHLVMMWSFPDDALLYRELLPFFDLLNNGPERQERRDFFEGVLAEARTQTGTVYPGPLSTVGSMFREMWAEAVSKSASPEALLLFAQTIQEWLSGVLLETQYKNGRTVPDCEDDIISIRKKSAAIISCVLIAEVILENPLRSPVSWLNSPEMQSMLDATNDIVIWHNDLRSFKREVIRDDQIFNMVLAVSAQRRVTYQEAGQIVVQMLNQRLVDLEAAAADLERITPPDLQPNFAFYRETCRCIVSGTVYWHAQSIRYQ